MVNKAEKRKEKHLKEKEAKENEIPYEKGEFPWAASGKALILNASQGKTKILFRFVMNHTVSPSVR